MILVARVSAISSGLPPVMNSQVTSFTGGLIISVQVMTEAGAEIPRAERDHEDLGASSLADAHEGRIAGLAKILGEAEEDR